MVYSIKRKSGMYNTQDSVFDEQYIISERIISLSLNCKAINMSIARLC